MQNPADGKSAAAGNNIGDAALFFEAGDGGAGNTAVNGNKIDAVLAVVFDGGENIIGAHFDDGAGFFNGFNGGLIKRHSSDGNSAGLHYRAAHSGNIAAGGQIHDGIGADINRGLQFGQLGLNRAEIGGSAEVGIDLGAQTFADAEGREVFMLDIGGNDNIAVRNAGADEFHVQFFLCGDDFHLRRNNTFSGHFELCHKTPP